MKLARVALPLIAAMLFTIQNAPAQIAKTVSGQTSTADLRAPGAEHKLLNILVGDWDYEYRNQWEKSDPEPRTKTGSCVVRWTNNNRFVEIPFNGQMGGKPMYGWAYLGYDTTKQQYTLFWVNNQNADTCLMETAYDPETHPMHNRKLLKTWEFEGTMDNPVTGRKNNVSVMIIMNNERGFDLDIQAFVSDTPRSKNEMNVFEVYAKSK